MVPDMETSLPVNAGWIKVQASYGVGGGKSWLKHLSGGPLRFLLPHLAQGFWQRDVTYLQVEIPGFSSASSSGSTLLSITREWCLSPQPCRWLRVWFRILISVYDMRCHSVVTRSMMWTSSPSPTKLVQGLNFAFDSSFVYTAHDSLIYIREAGFLWSSYHGNQCSSNAVVQTTSQVQ